MNFLILKQAITAFITPTKHAIGGLLKMNPITVGCNNLNIEFLFLVSDRGISEDTINKKKTEESFLFLLIARPKHYNQSATSSSVVFG